MKKWKRALIFSLLVVTSGGASLVGARNVRAQETKCTVKMAELKQAPEVYGFRLGMTVEQIKALAPTLRVGRADEFGFASVSLNPDFDARILKNTYAGVRTFTFDFLDDHLSSFWIAYNSSFKWQSQEEFIAGMSRALGWPAAAAWVTTSRGWRQLDCSDFQIGVRMIGGSPSIHLSDAAAQSLFDKRRADKEEAQP